MFSVAAMPVPIPTSPGPGLVSSRPHRHFSLFVFFILAILLGAKCSLTVGLICFSLTASDVEHLSMCLLVIHLCAVVEMSVQVFCPFFSCVFSLLSSASSLYILDTGPSSNIGFADILSCFMGCRFTFLMVSFEAKTFLILMKSS